MKRLLVVAAALAGMVLLAPPAMISTAATVLSPSAVIQNGDFEEDTVGTSKSAISDWDYQLTVDEGNPPTGDDLQIVNDYYFTHNQSVYSYLETTSVEPWPGDSRVSQYLLTENPINTTANYINLWIGGDGYTTSDRYFWRIALISTDGTNTHEEILRCDCWGNNEGCTPNHYDYYDGTATGADGTTWKRYTREIPDNIDKSNLTIKIRHDQASWDLTQASSWYRLDTIHLSPQPVGGIAEFPADEADTVGGSSSPPYAALGAVAAVAVVVLVTSAWYARRRWVR